MKLFYEVLRKYKNKYKKGFILIFVIVLIGGGSVSGYGFGSFRSRIDKAETHFKSTDSLSDRFIKDEECSTEKLAEAKRYARDTGFTSVIVFHKGKLVAEWGDTQLVSSVHSVRKSILSLLIGIAIEKGSINLDATLAELGIDEVTSLTEREKTANVRQLLMARSGIYLYALGETDDTIKAKPARGIYDPGEKWVYNNWDFNVLGVIFEKSTGMTIGSAVEEWLAKPLAMQDFKPSHVTYRSSERTLHPQYVINMSARDLARIGLLVQNHGQWEGKQIVSAKYITEATTPFSKNLEEGEDLNYGYCWWILEGKIIATGYGRQSIVINPKNETVVVTKVFTGNNPIQKALFGTFGPKIEYEQYNHLLNKLYSFSNIKAIDSAGYVLCN